LAERKIIEKAKGILMRRRTIDEEAAFQMMRKMAMDKNLKLAEVAKNIINVDTLFT
jgi:response regulator NasT